MPKRQHFISENAGPLRLTEGRWAATLITAGEGSSGAYSEEMLAEYAPKAFPKGTKLWFGHPKEGEGPGDRDPRDQWGVLDEDAIFQPGDGAVGKIRVLSHWKDVVESLGDQASLSIYALGESDDDGNVTALIAHETNSVDMVGYPGRQGSGLKKKIEAARAASHKPAAEASAEEKKENHMDEKDVQAIAAATAAAITESLKDVISFVNESAAKTAGEAQTKVDAEALDTARAEGAKAAAESFKLIDDAKLPDEIAEDFRSQVLEGKDITSGITIAKNVAEAAAKAGPVNEYVLESAAGDSKKNTDWSF